MPKNIKRNEERIEEASSLLKNFLFKLNKTDVRIKEQTNECFEDYKMKKKIEH